MQRDFIPPRREMAFRAAPSNRRKLYALRRAVKALRRGERPDIDSLRNSTIALQAVENALTLAIRDGECAALFICDNRRATAPPIKGEGN